MSKCFRFGRMEVGVGIDHMSVWKFLNINTWNYNSCQECKDEVVSTHSELLSLISVI